MLLARTPAKDRSTRPTARRLGIVLLGLVFFGCASGDRSRQVVNFQTAAPLGVATAQATLAQAQEADRLGQDRSVDLYYQATVEAMPGLQQPAASDIQSEEVYRQAMAGLIDAGQRYGRLDPRRQLIILDGGTRVVPIRYFGFAWRPEDFSRLTSVEGQDTHDIDHHYANLGLGLPLVGERVAACPKETFFRPWQTFPVTAVLRPATDMVDPSTGIVCGQYVLELYNSLVFDRVEWGSTSRPLARDLTAPFAKIVNEAPRQYLRGFTAPTDTSVQQQLILIEPYQRGKIPVVFIHGLYSDPITWVDMANELRVQRDLYDQYQFWTYRYPTGGEVLESAAILRQRLQLVRDSFDPLHTDPALDDMVLIGHSLGGVLSKMQVTSSSDLLWREVAQQPFYALRAPPELQARLARDFFYEPVPMVKRVIFIGTPHRGSNMTRRLAGRVGSVLVNFGSEEQSQYQELMDNNQEVFKPIVERRRPTSINMLDPDSPFLEGLIKMPVNCTTHLHSIIGTGTTNPFGEPGDGVVAVSSAQHYGDSEIFVPAKHEKLHRHPSSISEVARILRLHACAFHQKTMTESIRYIENSHVQ